MKAILWTGSELIMRQGLQLGIAIFLARMLTPEQFGTVALLYVFIGIGTVFIESGFPSALVQKQDITHTDESTVFWFNLVMGAVVAVLLVIIAPLIAQFFQQPILTDLMGVLAFSVFVSALGGIQHTLLTKQLNFKAPMQASVTASVMSGGVVCYLAYHGYGVWSLVWQTLANNLVTSCLLWLFSNWRPALVFSLESLKKLFGFGSYLMLTSLMDVVYNRFYGLIIGKIYSVHDLGIYNRAENTKQIPVDLLSMLMYRVAFPLFAATINDQKRLRRGVMIAIRGVMFLNVPIMLGMIVTCDKLVPIIFGQQWLPSVPILQVLCLSGALWPLHVINLNVLKALGHTNLMFRLEILKKILGLVFILVGFSYGIMGLAWSQVVFGVVAFWINSFYTERFLNFGFIKQFKEIFPVFIASGLMAVGVYQLDIVLIQPLGYKLGIEIVFGVLLYVLFGILLRLKSIGDIERLVGIK